MISSCETARFVGIILGMLMFPNIESVAEGSFCLVHDILHVYCPGCGATRAFLSLLRLDVAAAAQYNLMVFILPVYVLFLIATLVFEKVNPQKGSCAKIRFRASLILVAIWLSYFVIRNVLLLVFGIDLVGDFS